MSRILISYFSRPGMNYVAGDILDLPVGNTQVAAQMLEELTGGALFRIETVQPYPEDYHACSRQASQELRGGVLPELRGRVAHMEDYDTVLLGYPNWCGTMPMAVWTFLNAYSFAGKTILPFCTNEGSGLGRSLTDLALLCPDARVGAGLSIRGGGVAGARPELERWLKDSGLL